MHILCTICSDIVNHAESIFVTKCGHLFHHHCLTQWIERSKTCPQCRNKVTEKCMFRVYPTAQEAGGGEDAPALQSRLDDASLQLRQLRQKQQEAEDKMKETRDALQKTEKMLKDSEKKLLSRETTVCALKEQLEYLKVQNKETQRLREQNETLTRSMQTLTALEAVLNGAADEVERMLEGYADLRTVATFATALKRALCESESKKKEQSARLQAARSQLAAERAKTTTLKDTVKNLQERLILEARPGKRKSDHQETPPCDHAPCKMHKGDAPDTPRDHAPSPSMASAAAPASPNLSFGSLVRRAESAESPYLALRQSNVALRALQARPAALAARPAALAARPAALASANSKSNKSTKPAGAGGAGGALSIFRPARALEYFDAADPALELSYDGLGGHSKEDKFPTPAPRPLKPLLPKLSSRPRLKRPPPPPPPPPPAGTRSIIDMLNRSQ